MNTHTTPPAATVTSEARATVCRSMMRRLSAGLGVDDFGGVERGGEALLFAEITCAVPELRPSDAGRAVASDQVAARVLAEHLVDENVLGDDDVTFHPHYLGDVGDAPRAVAQARGLDDDVHRGADHLANGLRRQRIAAHRDHRFQT